MSKSHKEISEDLMKYGRPFVFIGPDKDDNICIAAFQTCAGDAIKILKEAISSLEKECNDCDDEIKRIRSN